MAITSSKALLPKSLSIFADRRSSLVRSAQRRAAKKSGAADAASVGKTLASEACAAIVRDTHAIRTHALLPEPVGISVNGTHSSRRLSGARRGAEQLAEQVLCSKAGER